MLSRFSAYRRVQDISRRSGADVTVFYVFCSLGEGGERTPNDNIQKFRFSNINSCSLVFKV